MMIQEIDNREEELITALTELWEGSVRETHKFLTARDIRKIKTYVPEGLKQVSILLVAREEQNSPVGFAGIADNRLEMLFIDEKERGKGLGTALIQRSMTQYGVSEVCVNEQNPQARGFYERMGFKVYKREPLDEQGQPFPLLYMRR